MGFLQPSPPAYDLAEFAAAPWRERVRLACVDWAANGFGAPGATYLFYVVKTVLYVAGWWAFVRATPGLEGGIGDWWDTTIAFQKAIVWTMLWESMGFGAGSGPLTGRYFPPVVAFVHFLWPGTLRLPPFPDRVPFTAGHRRSPVDAGLYAGYLVATVLALSAAEIGPAQVWPVLATLCPLALRDRTVFLAARAEHYVTTLVVFLFVGDVVAGSKAVQVAIWWWAATSKLNSHFPAVLAVMLSNHPLNRLRATRDALFVDPPHDLRPSRVPQVLAHVGTAVEYAFPVLLLVGDGGPWTTVGLVTMVAFHSYIISSVPLGVPIEWNVVVLYGGFVLFAGDNAAVMPWDVDPLLGVLLLVALVVLPAYGNARPDRVSFLPSMRYYAGNWAYSTWLLRQDALDRIDERVRKVADDPRRQLARFYPDDVTDTALHRVLGFRSMHLHGRLLADLAPRAVDDPCAYELRDGELVCGVTVGWNFGDGHLHDERLLQALQAECGFAEGDVVAILVESEPALPGTGRGTWHWRIVDAATGVRDEGHAVLRDVRDGQPWAPTPLS